MKGTFELGSGIFLMAAISALLLTSSAPFGPQSASFDPQELEQLPLQDRWSRYSPDWIVQTPTVRQETATLSADSPVELFQLRPEEAFRLLTNVSELGSRSVLIPAGTILVRAPGPLNVACEMLRQPGYERRTCLIDNDLDGIFDSFFRRLDTSPLLMVPAQSPQIYRNLTIKQVEGRPAYQPLDEDVDLAPIRFRLRYNRLERRNAGESQNYVSVCMARYETDMPQGREFFGRDCLARIHTVRDRELPYRFTTLGNTIVLRSTGDGGVVAEIDRPYDRFAIKLNYEI